MDGIGLGLHLCGSQGTHSIYFEELVENHLASRESAFFIIFAEHYTCI